jgi:hypothetical protein
MGAVGACGYLIPCGLGASIAAWLVLTWRWQSSWRSM